MTILVHNLDQHPTKPFHEFVDLQRDFKTYGDLRRLAERIRRVGFKYDFFTWEATEAVEYQGNTYPAGTCFIIDAHSRQRTLAFMEKEGDVIPPVPFTRIQAASLAEAKEEILFLNSNYGEIDDDSDFLQTTLAEMEEEDKALLALMGEESVELEEITDKQEPLEQEMQPPIKKIHILLTIPVSRYHEVIGVLEQLERFSFIEREQSGN